MSDTGRWEFARILAVAGNDLTLRQALQHTFTSGVTQVVRVPEFTTVNIPAGSSLRPAHAWDGIKGGIIAFLATGLVTVNGDISVDGAGPQGPQRPAGPQGPVGPQGEGLMGGSLLMLPAGSSAPAGYMFVGTFDLAPSGGSRGRPAMMSVDVYRRN